MISFSAMEKMKRLKIILKTVICLCVVLTSSVNCSALDVSLNSKEENYLLYYKIIRDSCQRKEDENSNCTKYIIRYDGINSKIEELKKLSEINYYISPKEMLEKGGTVLVGITALGTAIYLIPISFIFKVFSIILGCAFICKAYSYATNAVLNLFKRLTSQNITESNDKGLLNNAIEVMFGNKVSNNITWTSFKNSLFGNKSFENIRKIKEAEAFKNVLNEFYKLVKERKFQKNNVLIISIDFTDIENIKSKLKFGKTFLNLGEYPKKDEEYFEKWL